MQLLALAIAPGIAICLFIFHRDAYNREPKRNLVAAFLLGALGVYPAAFLERLLILPGNKSFWALLSTAFFCVALVEEGVKFLAVRFYAYNRKSFDEPLDGIVYAVVVSMGFATLENILYIFQSDQQGLGYQVAFLRMFLAVPAHGCFGVLMGYYVGKAKFAGQNRPLLLMLGLAAAVFFHGLYDFFLFLRDSSAATDSLTALLMLAGAIASFILAVRLSYLRIEKHRKLSQQTYNPMETMTIRPAYAHDIPLIRDLAIRIWPTAYGRIISAEQITYMLEMMYSEKSLAAQMQEGIRFIIAYDGVEPVGFAAFGLQEPGICKLHKLYVLPQQQGKGTGALLIRTVEEMAGEKEASLLQLNVNRLNPAVGFYEKIGFSIVEEQDLDIGQGFQMNDYLMAKPLN